MTRQKILNPFETVDINVYDVITKSIVFTGSITDAAKYMGVLHKENIHHALRLKHRIKKKYAVRYKSIKTQLNP
jgi:hypothetical protein